MLLSISLIFIVGLVFATLCKKINLPGLIGLLFTGILLGPHVLNLLDDKVLLISPELRKIALIIILLKAGLSLDLTDLKKVGRPALLLSFLPASFEILAYCIFAPMILHVSTLDALIIGSVLGAVSPAVVVPKMVQLMDNGYGSNKSIPQMILAGSSLDDVYTIVLFSTFTTIALGGSAKAMDFVNIPLQILIGVAIGYGVGLLLVKFFEFKFDKDEKVRNSMKVIIMLAVSFLLVELEGMLKGFIPFSGLLAVMAMGMTIAAKMDEPVKLRLSAKFGKLWLAAEVILFVLVGAAVDINYTLNAGWAAVLMVFVALAIRSCGVACALIKTNLNFKERIFAIIAYLPKATVQAAIGGVPLAMGLDCGNIVLSMAVVGILITAPLGAFGMDATYKKLLQPKEI